MAGHTRKPCIFDVGPEFDIQLAAAFNKFLDSGRVDPVVKNQTFTVDIQLRLEGAQVPEIASQLRNDCKTFPQIGRESNIDLKVLTAKFVFELHAGILKIDISAAAGVISPVDPTVDQLDIGTQNQRDQFFGVFG